MKSQEVSLAWWCSDTATAPTPPEKDVEVEGLMDEAFLFHNVLSEAECRYLIEQAEQRGWERVIWETVEPYRKNERVIFFDTNFADFIFKRISPHIEAIPQQITETDNNTILWKPFAIDPNLRLCRYLPGGLFGAHYDGQAMVNLKQATTQFPGVFVRQESQKENESESDSGNERKEEDDDSTNKSIYTCMLYLSHDMKGGSTNFLDETDYQLVDGSCSLRPGCTKKVTCEVNPRAGSAILFNKKYLHEGAAVTEGMKYILRTDLLFKKK